MGSYAILPFFGLETKTQMCYIVPSPNGADHLEIDERLVAEHGERQKRALAVGISHLEMQIKYGTNIAALEAEISRRTNERAGAGWLGKMEAFLVRRKRIAAAYLAGASLTQLAALEGISSNTIHTLIRKELPADLRQRLAKERTAPGRRREPIWTPTQVSAAIGAVSDVDVKLLPVAVVAARMFGAARITSEDDESDPIDEADTPGRKMPEADR